MLTGLLGAGVALDAFVVMMKIPSVFRRLFAEGAFNAAFIPMFKKSMHNKKQTVDFTNYTISIYSHFLRVY